MSRERFDDDCPGCRLVLVDPETMQVLPEDHAVQQAARRTWARTTRVQREAFHRVMCLNSRDGGDLRLVEEIHRMLQKEARPS